MNKLICILLMGFSTLTCFAQYTVTKVIGNVKIHGTGENLKPGSRLSDNDVLIFSSQADMVRAIVAGKGIYLMTPSPRAASQQNTLVEALKSTLHVKSKEGYLSGRSDENELIPESLETETTVNQKILITSENKYLFSKKTYDVSSGNRFFLQEETPGHKPVIHPLKTIADTLIIYAADFGNENKEVVYKLGFYSGQKKTSELLIRIWPNIDTTGVMENIIKLLIATDPKKDRDDLQKECYSEIYQSLGKPSDVVFKHIFNKAMSETK